MLRTLSKYVGKYKLLAILTPLFIVGEVVCEVAIPYLMASIIDDGVRAGDMHHVYVTGALMILMALLSLAAGVAAGITGAKASAGFATNLRYGMYENIQNFSFSNLDKFSTAGLVTRLTTDVTNVQMAFQMILRMFTRAPVMLISAMTMAFLINWRLAMIFLGASIFLLITLGTVVRIAHPRFQRVFEKYDGLNASVQENLTGIRVVKAYVREEHETKKFHSASDFLYKCFVSAEKIVALNNPVMNIAVYSCIILISWFGAHLIIGGSMTEGNLTSFFTYTMNILNSLMMISMIFVMTTMARSSAERICEVLKEESNLRNPAEPVFALPDGSVTFDDVCFSYAGRDDKLNLEHVSFTIGSGRTVGVIGGTGSAKSTLVQLIPRLYDVTGGSIRVGGIDVRDYDIEALRNEVSMVLQKNVLFSGTIKENLRWGNEAATDEEMERACRLASAHEFIEKMPDKYDTYIEQGGTNVSGGQKQRLCIARALLKKPKILILDDSTSAVDTRTDAMIRQAFRDEIPDTTKIIIAQRIHSVMEADKIIVLNEGKIDGFGTHEELLRDNAIYKEVYESQLGGGDCDEA